MINKLQLAVLATVTTGMSYAQFCGGGPTSSAGNNLESFDFVGATSTISYTGCAGGSGVTGVEDQTAMVADVVAGSAYSLDAVFGSCNTTMSYGVTSIWVDWNADEIFQNTELVTDYSGNFPDTVAMSVTVPANAVNGNRRMRVLQRNYGSLPVDPCASFTRGSVTDFTLAVTGGTGCAPALGLNLVASTNASAELAWSASATSTAYVVEYGTQGFTPGTGTSATVTTALTQTISGLSGNSMYDFYIRSICGPGDTSTYVGPVTANTFALGAYMDWDKACPTSNFIDITTTGTDLDLGDDAEATITMPFPFLYQGVYVNDLRIGNNGGLLINAPTGNIWSYMSGTNGMFPYTQDLDSDINGVEVPGVFHEVMGTAPNRQLVIMWKDRTRYSGSNNPNPATFEIIIDEASQDFWYVYDDVDMGNENYDYGKDAEIGILGVNRDIVVSDNDNAYLRAYSCIHFFNTDCPNVSDITTIDYLPNQIGVSWSAGIAGESNWTIEWGLPGFTPGNGIGSASTTSSTYTITNLSPLTEYEIYVYADCNPTTSASGNSLLATTATACANPFGVTVGVGVDSIMPTWNWMPNGSGSMATGFNIHYAPVGTPLFGGTTYTADALNFTEDIEDPSIISSGIYEIYMQTVCGTNDTSLWVGPINFIADRSNDSLCLAQELATDGTVYLLSNNGASLQVGESTINPPVTNYTDDMGWGSSGIYKSMWYTFVAPASGSVWISGRDEGYNGRIAVYGTTDCADFSQFTFMGGNDNANLGSYSQAPEFIVCGLTPGDTYYLLQSTNSSSTSNGTFSIKMEEVNLNAGVAEPVFNACLGDTVNLFNTVTGYDVEYGNWLDLENTSQLINDSLFATSILASRVYEFMYEVKWGCALDTVRTQVEIYAPSNAGDATPINVCKNEPINLFQGLTGNVNLGGSWYDPQNNVITSNIPSAGPVPGQFNYDYITGNGVCPNDTALVVVVVDPTCDFLGLDEMETGAIELYPNPSTNVVNVASASTHADLNLQVIDVNGRVVVSKTKFLSQNEVNTVDVSALSKGMYIFKLYNNEVVKSIRVIVE